MTWKEYCDTIGNPALKIMRDAGPKEFDDLRRLLTYGARDFERDMKNGTLRIRRPVNFTRTEP